MSDNDDFSDDNISDSGSESENENTFTVKKTSNPIKNVSIKLNEDSDQEDSDNDSNIDSDEELAKGADERDDIDDDEVRKEDGVEDDEETSYNKNIVIPVNPLVQIDDDDDEEDGEEYLQKFNSQVNKNYIVDYHPECISNNYEEIATLSKLIRDSEGNIIDDLHKTLPFLTKYEKARILGQRAKQINTGAKAFVKVPENIIDGYLIANMELEQKRIPFIIRRPIAGGSCEYWNLKDLENVAF
jgi:DNA-directed RNA polymerase I, II, and III subunit RPABC2